MWLTQGGALCYYSKKEEKNLIYYPADDLVHAEIKILGENEYPGKPYNFEVPDTKRRGLLLRTLTSHVM